MPKSTGARSWLRPLIALVLLPVCWGCSAALLRVTMASTTQIPFWVALGTGGLVWWVLFLNLPKPMWIYVVGHELTHAVWTWVFGGRVKRFKATSTGGHVVITKSNFLITLSPYFFPLYALGWVALFAAANALWSLDRFLWVGHFGLGFLYAFHITLTVHILHTQQPDLQSEGVFFSIVIIWLGNVLTPLLILPAFLKAVGWGQVFGWCLDETLHALRFLGDAARAGGVEIGRWMR